MDEQDAYNDALRRLDGMTVDDLVASEDVSLRTAAASSPGTHQQALGRLAGDPVDAVREAIGGNESSPGVALVALAADSVARVQMAVAGNAAAPEDALRQLADHPNAAIREIVAGNEATPRDLLSQLANDPVLDVRRAATNNSHGPVGPTGDIRRGAAERVGGSATISPRQQSRGAEWVRALEQQGQELIAVAGRFLPSSSVDSMEASVREALENARQVASGRLPNPPAITTALPDTEFLPGDVASRQIAFYNLYSVIDPRTETTSSPNPSEASAYVAGGRDEENGHPMVAVSGPPQAGTAPRFVSTSGAVGTSGQMDPPEGAAQQGGEVKSASAQLEGTATVRVGATRIPAEAEQVQKVSIRTVDRGVVRQNLDRHGEGLVTLTDVLLQQLDTILSPRRFGDNNPPIEDSDGHDLRPELEALYGTLRQFREALASAIVDPARSVEPVVESGDRLNAAVQAIAEHPLVQRPLLGLAAVGVSAVAMAAGVPVDPNLTMGLFLAGPEGVKAIGDALRKLGGPGT